MNVRTRPRPMTLPNEPVQPWQYLARAFVYLAIALALAGCYYFEIVIRPLPNVNVGRSTSTARNSPILPGATETIFSTCCIPHVTSSLNCYAAGTHPKESTSSPGDPKQ